MRPDQVVMVPADPERLTVDLLQAALGDEANVGTDLPHNWTTGSPTFIQVAHDGTPTMDWPARIVATMRITVWARKKSTSRDIAARCMGLLLAADGYRQSTGLLLAVDSGTAARLTSFAVLHSSMTRHIENSPVSP